MEIFLWSAVFIIALAAVVKSAAYFTDAAEKIGIHFKLSPFIIGVTIVALGTSLPELVTSMSAVLHGHSEIVIGDVVGSNIANILLVMAIAAIVGKHLFVTKDIIKIDLPIVLASSIFLYFTTTDGKFTYVDGTLALLGLTTYILYNIMSHRLIEKDEIKLATTSVKKDEKKEKGLPLKYPLILGVSVVALYFSAEYTITSVVKLSELFNIGKEIIAVSAIAIGTSLPELVVSITAASKGKTDLAIGNVAGSNIFNALGVMGIPALFGTLTIPPEMISFTIPALLVVTILYVFTTMDKEITQWEGVTLLLLYVAFIGKTFGLL